MKWKFGLCEITIYVNFQLIIKSLTSRLIGIFIEIIRVGWSAMIFKCIFYNFFKILNCNKHYNLIPQLFLNYNEVRVQRSVLVI